MTSTSPLLRLPAELRNTICQLALTHSKPLHYHAPKRAGDKPYLYRAETPFQQVDDEKPVEYNQLKYVNRQLWAETAALELKFNDITLCPGPKPEMPSEVLADWVSTMSIGKRSWIKTISIRSGRVDHELDLMGDSPVAVARLTQLCNAIPNMKVKYYRPLWAFCTNEFGANPAFFFVLAQFFSHAFRGQVFKDVLISADDQYAAMVYATNWREGDHNESPKVELARLQAGNLKYFPIMPTDTPVPVIKADYTIARDDEVISEAEQWIGNKYMREWMEHGI